MTLKETLQKNIITAMKAKDKATANTLRMVSAALTKQEQAKGQKGELTVDQELQILNKELKSRHEELEAFKSVNNQEKVDQITSEIEIIKSYQPRQLSDDELKAIILKTIDETGLRNAGPLTGKVMAQVKGQAEGSHVRTLILEILND
jgi:gatB/yqey domain protein